MIKLKTLIFWFLLFWIVSVIVVAVYGDLQNAGWFGDSFGAVNSLFSGIALALAIYSMILQQRQNDQFEQQTVSAMQQQAETLSLIKTSLVQQANFARVTALMHMIGSEEERIKQLEDWGRQKENNEKLYAGGIKKAEDNIKRYQEEIKKIGAGD